MGIYILSAEEIRESFHNWLMETSMNEQGDITARTIAECFNTIAKEEEWSDRLKVYEVEE